MTIDPTDFIDELVTAGVTFFAGVPDNINSSFCFALDLKENIKHINVPHESHAVALVAGNNIKSSDIGLVYLQNSGLGNIVNPVTSICHKQVYDTPCIFLVGHRQDEAQHEKMGSITKPLLRQMDIKHAVINKNFKSQIKRAVEHCRKKNKSFALISNSKTFDKIKLHQQKSGDNRRKILETVCRHVGSKHRIVTCTGYTSRELFEIQKNRQNNFILNVGGMGLTGSLAAGIAHQHKGKVFCVDGDAAVLMHAGALTVTAQCNNLIHILLNNGMHESVGKNSTSKKDFDFKALARASGYKTVIRCDGRTLDSVVKEAIKTDKSSFIEICTNGESSKLSRPNIHLKNLKKNI